MITRQVTLHLRIESLTICQRWYSIAFHILRSSTFMINEELATLIDMDAITVMTNEESDNRKR